MGKKDSSRTRVVPVFDKLIEKDPTGCKWLSQLLRLPVAGNILAFQPEWPCKIKDCGWGNKEKKLDPPVSLLSWLIRHPRGPVSGKLSSDSTKEQKRRQWIKGSQEAIIEGLHLLRHNPNGEDWFIFEGQSQPDVFIETEDLIIVIEGKRTEKRPTSTTKWMPIRSQMLRHIDCAWEIRGKKQVIGFYIVEGEGQSEKVPEKWRSFSAETICSDILASSLPHRGQEEREGIASCFIGATTWQRICLEFGIDWMSLPNEVDR